MNPTKLKNSNLSLRKWYSYKGGVYNDDSPAFFDTASWEWMRNSETTFPIIRNEIENLLSKKNNILEPYFNSDLLAESSTLNKGDGHGKWEVGNFYFWGKENTENCEACPELVRLLKSIPGMLTAGISRLAPATEIKPHHGDTNMIARCHLGLSIPEGLPNCGIKVKNEIRQWENGKWFAFCDAHEHSAWNRTDKFRYILIVDVVLPQFIGQKKEIEKNVRSLLSLQNKLTKNPTLKNLPGFVLAVMRQWYKLGI